MQRGTSEAGSSSPYSTKDAMPTPFDTFASYVPAAVTRHHSLGAPAPDQPSHRPLRAALLFADISGFTALAERLAQCGPAGVEELSRLLNTSFGRSSTRSSCMAAMWSSSPAMRCWRSGLSMSPTIT